MLPLKGALTYITFACLTTRPGRNPFPQLPSLTSRSQSSGERVPRWGSLALSNSCVRRARGSCWVVNGCWRIEEGSGWSLAPRPLLSSIEPPAPAPSPASHLQKLLSCWPLLGVLGQGQLEEVVEILGPSKHKSPHTPGPGLPSCRAFCHLSPAATPGESAGPAQEEANPWAAGLSDAAITTWRLFHHQPSALPPCPQLPGPFPQMACGGPERIRLLRLHPGNWRKAPPPPVQTGWKGDPYKGHGFSPVTLVSQLRWLEAALGHEHQGPAEAQGQESRVSKAFGVRQRASVRPTSWGAGGIKGAAARQARWQ